MANLEAVALYIELDVFKPKFVALGRFNYPDVRRPNRLDWKLGKLLFIY
jgi:hypothetical protein